MAFTWTPYRVQIILSALVTEKDDDCEVRESLSNQELHNSVMYEIEEVINFVAPPPG
jgi:hypothetical protein